MNVAYSYCINYFALTSNFYRLILRPQWLMKMFDIFDEGVDIPRMVRVQLSFKNLESQKGTFSYTTVSNLLCRRCIFQITLVHQSHIIPVHWNQKNYFKVTLKEVTISHLLLLQERFWWIMRPEKANQGEFLWGKHGLLSREGEFPAQSGLYSYWYCTIPYVPW